MTQRKQSGVQQRPRVALIGQSNLVVEAIARPLAAVARVSTIPLEACPSTGAAFDVVQRSNATIVVLVLSHTDVFDAPDLVAELAARGQRVVAAGQVGDANAEAELLREGAAATIGADHGLADLVSMIERGAVPAARPTRPDAGRTTKSTSPADRARNHDRRVRRNLGRLTPAEARILWRLMQGYSVKDIARVHVVSVETVRSQIRTLLCKLEAGSQLAAVAQAWQVGWSPTSFALRAA